MSPANGKVTRNLDEAVAIASCVESRLASAIPLELCTEQVLQCDESKPSCKRCIAFHVSCNYRPSASDLQLAVEGAFNLEALQRSTPSLNQTIINMINAQLGTSAMNSPDNSASYRLDPYGLELMHKFQSRTVFSIGTKETINIYHHAIARLACSVCILRQCKRIC